MLRAAIYARVSTEDQAVDGFSISAQVNRLGKYCRARQWKISEEYLDKGYSGRNPNRPSYQRMLADREKWDVLLVLKMDRIHRNSKNFAIMMDKLKDWGKEFNSMQESFDTTTAMGRFVMDIIQRIAQLESEQIAERVKMGMSQKAKKGEGYLGFGEPYGFCYSDDSLEVNETEAEVVRRIFSLYAEGNTLSEIADRLNNEVVPTKRGGKWRKQTISKMLKNPLYCGYMEWDGIVRQAPHQEIVEVELFNRVQRMMRSNVRNKSRMGDYVIIGEGGACSD